MAKLKSRYLEIVCISKRSPKAFTVSFSSGQRKQKYHDITLLQLCSREGDFIESISDSLIESGLVAWIAGEQWKLNALSKGCDIYNILASRLNLPTGRLIHMIENYARYNIPAGFLAARVNHLISQGSLQLAYSRYKESHPNTQRLWKDLVHMAQNAILNPGMPIDYAMAKNGKHRYKGICFIYHAPFMQIRLPDGSVIEKKIYQISYNHDLPILKNKKKKVISGGQWLQMITQALCQHMMEKTMLDLELSGFYLDHYEPSEIDLCCGKEALLSRFKRYLKEPLQIGTLLQNYLDWQPLALSAPRPLLPAPRIELNPSQV